jgi:hypothetical protein
MLVVTIDVDENSEPIPFNFTNMGDLPCPKRSLLPVCYF